MSKRERIWSWNPNDSGGYEKREQEVYFDGEHLEVVETVSGYGGYSARIDIPKALLVQLLGEYGLHIVDANAKELLDLCEITKINHPPDTYPGLDNEHEVALAILKWRHP